jgi:hypothetical protein
MEKIDRVIAAFRKLNEEAPTNNVGGGQIAGTKEAGDDPLVRGKKRKIYLAGMRKWWRQMTEKNK